ncbi:MAG: HAD-IG family 5'-nucleotidase [Rhodothermales bacterium]
MQKTGLESALYCNRTLNLRKIQAIGYDMDYTLVHYHMKAWEERTYDYIKEKLESTGWPVSTLSFDPNLVMRGLIIDTELGNVVKADRFGYVKYAFHGSRAMPLDVKKQTYSQTVVDLNDRRWVFLNTLFSISEAGIYLQLVDLFDQGLISPSRGYDGLYEMVKRSLDQAHMEGRLKGEIVANPDAFVDLDSRMPRTLLDQKEAGKRLLLITNSEWSFASSMLSYTIDPFLPNGTTWRELFDIVIVGARKPTFFSSGTPAFEVVSEDGLLREHVGKLETGRAYVGANAALVEESLNISGEEILYVGDHLFADVNVSKSVLRWRTALVIRELEDEIAAVKEFMPQQEVLSERMIRKKDMEADYSAIRLRLQRIRNGHETVDPNERKELSRKLDKLRDRLVALDAEIGPLAQRSGELLNPNWGLLMRTGKDKSHYARQVERYADVYMTRVSDFLEATPFVYLRSHRGSLPHDSLDSEREVLSTMD